MQAIFKNAQNRHELCFSDDPERYADILVSYKQRGRVVLRKTAREMEVAEGCGEGRGHWIVSWLLTPCETQRFTGKQPVFVQAMKIREDGSIEPGEIRELDVIESLDPLIPRAPRDGGDRDHEEVTNCHEAHVWRMPF